MSATITRASSPSYTWGGLRGGISVALVLSLPPFPEKELLLGCTYGVVLFSVLAQGLSMRRVFAYYGVGEGGQSIEVVRNLDN